MVSETYVKLHGPVSETGAGGCVEGVVGGIGLGVPPVVQLAVASKIRIDAQTLCFIDSKTRVVKATTSDTVSIGGCRRAVGL